MKKHEKKTIKFLLTLFFIVACIVSINAQVDTTGINNVAQNGLNIAADALTVQYPSLSHALVGLAVAAIMWCIRFFEKKAMDKNNTPTGKN